MTDRRLFGGSGSDDGPVSPDAWKRAIHRRPPKNFHVKLLPPEKHGSSYSYGFRIHPTRDDNASIISRTTSSGASTASLNEYDIWRKWEDCLWWQDALEMEYSRAAREKRSRLAAGKGIKKNGIYVHSDQAASWESLPFGPDPDAIARNIHECIPKLSKKSTLFRASLETVHHRHEELIAMMRALFDDELPTLIKEIKATNAFTDFFGLWRRDIDLAQKLASSNKSSSGPQQSLSPTLLSNLPGSMTSLSAILPSPAKASKGKAPEKPQIRLAMSTHSDSSSEDSADPPRSSRLMDRAQEIRSTRSRGSSSESCSSSSVPSTPVAPSPFSSRQPLMASQDVPLRFGHNPLAGERTPHFLQSLPEDRELFSSPKPGLDEVPLRSRSGSAAGMMNRNTKIYVSSLASSESLSGLPPRSLSHHPRASFQSRHSSVDLRATAYLDELNVDYCLPGPMLIPRSHPRASVCSLASIVTNASVDAVIPRSDRPSRSFVNNAQRPSSLEEEPEEEMWSEYEPQSEDQGDLLDAYFCDLIAPQGYPETPMTYRFSQRQSPTTSRSCSRYSDRRASLSSQSTSSSGSVGVLSIKAVHEDVITVFRLPHYITFNDLRRKIYDKFMQTERPTISESFAVALMEQPSADMMSGQSGRSRTGSCSTIGSGSVKGTTLHFISSQEEWDDILATQSGKIVLRIIGSRE